jgi:DNA-binding NarL/FixJ family response regulator
VELIAQGLDNRGIAARLKITDKTVRNHVSAIFGKLAVNSRAQAILQARAVGFGHRVI